MTRRAERAFVHLATAAVLIASGCSVSREHRDRRQCSSDEESYEGFCIPKTRTTPDAGDADDAGPEPDGGADSGPEVDGGGDAGAPESCEEAGAVELCYPFDDPTTALQEPCRAGTRTCGEDHVFGPCSGHQGPKPETCDRIDNDCDGRTDEEQLQRTCTVTSGDVKGACAKDGASLCRDGSESCIQTVTPKSETCNGEDDDCDGETDEGLEIACYGGASGCTPNDSGGYDCVPASTCAPGSLRCVGGEMQTECSDDVRPASEAATALGEAALDEDCDGMIDEGFTCQIGEEYPCYSGPAATRGRSPCQDGERLCGDDGQFGGECVGEVTPAPETCANEGTDDDCDGTADDVPRRGTSCSDASSAQGACKANATWRCQAGAEVCVDAEAQTEVCDGQGVDEDCDGTVDEGFALQTDENNCGACGVRCPADNTCCGGSCVNTARSNLHCGGCSTPCAATLTCCSSRCVNTRNDESNCGTCGNGCLLGGLLSCSNGACL